MADIQVAVEGEDSVAATEALLSISGVSGNYVTPAETKRELTVTTIATIVGIVGLLPYQKYSINVPFKLQLPQQKIETPSSDKVYHAFLERINNL